MIRSNTVRIRLPDRRSGRKHSKPYLLELPKKPPTAAPRSNPKPVFHTAARNVGSLTRRHRNTHTKRWIGGTDFSSAPPIQSTPETAAGAPSGHGYQVLCYYRRSWSGGWVFGVISNFSLAAKFGGRAYAQRWGAIFKGYGGLASPPPSSIQRASICLERRSRARGPRSICLERRSRARRPRSRSSHRDRRYPPSLSLLSQGPLPPRDFLHAPKKKLIPFLHIDPVGRTNRISCG